MKWILLLIACLGIHRYDATAQQLLTVKDANGKVGFKDLNGKIVVEPKYNSISRFSEGYAAVKLDLKFGFVDSNGAEVIPLIYDDAVSFKNGWARMKHNGKWGWIDTQNDIVIPFQYDKARGFEDGLACVEVNDKWGFINTSNEIVVPIIYEESSSFHEGLARMKKNNRYGFVDKTGKTVIDFQYESATKFEHGESQVHTNGQSFYIDRNGKMLRKWEDNESVGVTAGAEPPPVLQVREEPVNFAEKMPTFPGGDAALFAFLSKNINYPKEAVENNIQGKVAVQMVIGSDGSITEVEIVRSIHSSLDREAMRVVKSMPKWNPGMQNGKPISVRYTIPVNFSLK